MGWLVAEEVVVEGVYDVFEAVARDEGVELGDDEVGLVGGEGLAMEDGLLLGLGLAVDC